MFLYLWGPGPHIPWCVPINSRCILLAYFDIVKEKECAICERKLTKCTKVYARISDGFKWDLSVDDGRVNAFSEKSSSQTIGISWKRAGQQHLFINLPLKCSRLVRSQIWNKKSFGEILWKRGEAGLLMTHFVQKAGKQCHVGELTWTPHTHSKCCTFEFAVSSPLTSDYFAVCTTFADHPDLVPWEITHKLCVGCSFREKCLSRMTCILLPKYRYKY